MADSCKARDFVRVRLTRNGTTLYDQSFVSEDTEYTEHATERVVLASSMSTSQQINLGGVATAGRIFLETNKSIQVSLNPTPANKWTLSDLGTLLFVGSFSHVWVRNIGTQVAHVQYVVTD